METGTHFHLAKKIHALNSNRVEKKHCSFLRVLSKKKIKKWYVSCFFLLFVLKYFIFYCFFFIQYWNVYYNKWPMGHITQLTCPTIDSIQSALQSFKNYLDNGVKRILIFCLIYHWTLFITVRFYSHFTYWASYLKKI